jgi:superkiller protein 3
MSYQEISQTIIDFKQSGDFAGLTAFANLVVPSLIDPVLKSQVLNEQAIAYLRLENSAKAEESLLQASELTPDSENIRFNLGSVYLSTKRYPSAKNCFSTIERQNPNHTGAIYNCGLINFYQEKLEEALTNFNRVMELEKDFAGAYYHAGEVYFVQEKYEEATSCYEKTLELSPDFVDAWKSCIYCYCKTGRYEKTIEEGHALMQQHGPDLRIVKTIGDAHFELNEFDNAIEAYIFMTQINEESMGHVMFQAKKMVQHDKRSHGEECFREILKHFPEYEDQIEELRKKIAEASEEVQS